MLADDQGKWRAPPSRRKIPPVIGPRLAAGFSVLALLLTSIPYLVAPTLAGPSASFGGFLLNPADGFSYLAKMRQGASGSMEFRLPYAADPGDGALLFVYHLVLGRVGAWVSLPPIVVYHAARIIGAAAMFAAAYLFFTRILPPGRARVGAFGLTLFGTGLGWLGLPFGLNPLDLLVPEAIPFQTAYANAHFPAAAALLLISVTWIVFDLQSWATYVSGVALALVQPFAVGTVVAVLATWGVVEEIWGRKSTGRSRTERIGRLWKPPWKGLAAYLLGALPVLAYDLWAIRSHVALREWAAQNVTPTPALLETLLGYGILLPLAVIGLSRAGLAKRSEIRLLVSWVLVNGLLLYAPLMLQRRLSLGLFFPLAALAGLGLDRLAPSGRRFAFLLALTLTVSLPSHAFVVASGLSAVSKKDPAVVLSEDDRTMYAWIAANLANQPLILGSPETGNQLPAFADTRVLYGHPFETPQAAHQLERVNELYSWKGEPSLGLQSLRDLGVQYVFYSRQERELGSPSWLSEVELVHEIGAAQLYRVPSQ